MRNKFCSLDLLPAEIFHILFGYFLAHEILLSFTDVSDYIDDILLAYSTWKLNFQSIRRDDFDLICDYIQPENVILLVLSDTIDTPGQSELFFSCFQIEQFLRLRSLKLINIEYRSLEKIFEDLEKLKQLNSLTFITDSIPFKYSTKVRHSLTEFEVREPIRIDNYIIQILPRLNRLYLTNAWNSLEISLPKLQYLKLTKCSYDQLKNIFQSAPYLQSLDVRLELNKSTNELLFSSSQLSRLRLIIENRPISMVQMEALLPNFPNLKQLELILSGHKDLINGYRWQILTHSLITFNFKFNTNANYPQLDSFGTSYWLEDKQWYVACRDNSIFSIPYFSPIEIDIEDLSYNQSTAPVILSPSSLRLRTVPRNQAIYYNNIKILFLNCSITRPEIFSLIELKHLTSLSILFITDLLIFQPYQSTIPNLQELIIKNPITFDLIEQFRGHQLEQIQNLSIFLHDTNLNLIQKSLFYCFPNIKSLKYISINGSLNKLLNVIDGFQYLLNVSFYIHSPFNEIESTTYSNLHSIIEKSRLTRINQITYRIEQISIGSSSIDLHFWIKPRPITSSSGIVQWPSRFTYIWYRLHSIISQTANTQIKQLMLQLLAFYIFHSYGHILQYVVKAIESTIGYESSVIVFAVSGLIFYLILYELVSMMIGYIAYYLPSTIRPYMFFLLTIYPTLYCVYYYIFRFNWNRIFISK